MSVVFWRLLIFLILGLVIFFGARRIWRDWTGRFRQIDKAEHERVRERDLRERQRPEVITLKRDKDGTFRPPGRDDDKA